MEQTVVEPMDVDVSFTVDDSATTISRDEKTELSNNRPIIAAEEPKKIAGNTFTTGIDVFGKEEQAKMEERAKRFGLHDKLNKSKIETDIDLYSSMGVADESEKSRHIRLNALHMRGTKDMSTKDVLKYFEDYGPTSVEWINDVSCNVVWVDNISAARALLKLSKRIVGLVEKVAADKHLKSEASSFDDENKLANDDCIIEVVGDDGSTGEGGGNDKIDDDNVISLVDIDCPLPPGLWRKGVDYPKSKVILLRFATRADKKQPKAEKMSDYYKKYGNPNFGGIKGLLTESRKRQYKQVRQQKKRADNGFSEDEDNGKRSKNPWGTLSETWGQNDAVEDTFLRAELTTEQKSSVKERLGIKSQAKEVLRVSPVPPVDEESKSESESESSDEEWCKRSKVLRMRMHADDEEEKMLKKRIKQRTQEMHASMQSKSNDLRSRLRNTKRNPVYRDAIQVVVTNTSDRFRVARPRSLTPEEQDDEDVERVHEDDIEAEEEVEEGEWVEASEQIEEPIEQEDEVEEEEEESDDSDVSEKEIQGPKGSVIKVVPRVKPRVASTVWARLNNAKPDTESKDRFSSKGDLRGTLKGDLRSRLGYQKRGRSPLRIEVKNDKYAEESSGTE